MAKSTAPEAKTVEKTTTTATTPAAGPSSYEVPGFVCSILSFIPLPVIGLILAICGIVFSAKQRRAANTSMATAGFILGIVGLVLQVLLLIYVIFVIYAIQTAPIY